MTAALRHVIDELRAGAEMSPEGATSIQWRERIKKIDVISVIAHGAGISMLASAARTLLLQRGQLSDASDMELRGILLALSNILEMELSAQDAARASRAETRRGTSYWLRDCV